MDRSSQQSSRLPGSSRAQLYVLLALVFLCGFFSGSLSRRLLAAMFPPGIAKMEGKNRHYIQAFTRRYRLDREQVRVLRVVLEERDRIKASILHQSHSSLSPELAEMSREQDREADRRIPKILRQDQLALYESDLRN